MFACGIMKISKFKWDIYSYHGTKDDGYIRWRWGVEHMFVNDVLYIPSYIITTWGK
jgi:hypothetical protein